MLHIGNGKWFIIDSCLCSKTRQPIALEYLRYLGVDFASQVIGILITHWHSDHINGAFELLKECKKAKLYHSGALTSDAALCLAALYQKDVFANIDKEIREFSNIVEFLYETKSSERLDPVKAQHTFFDQRENIQTRMIALSPSSTAVTHAIAKLKEITPKEGSNRIRNIVPESENLNAVAIHFTFGEFSALLGSDLEENGNKLTGWSGVFQSDIVSNLSLSNSSLFKVSHHGSETGHSEKIWQELLSDNPLSISTPFSRSGLPTPKDIERITNLSSKFLITRNPQSRKKIKRESMVEREMKAVAKNRMSINNNMGHIQIRISSEGKLNVAVNEQCAIYSSQRLL